jgi:hypothetical protein
VCVCVCMHSDNMMCGSLDIAGLDSMAPSEFSE